ncbi:MAG: ABC transporter permease [Ignavibacteria bacterium]|jgi:putative ABC transport system permease protein
MFKNYLTIAFRNFFRNKLFSFINVFGLAIGLAVCTIIYLWIDQELNYDSFHENADRVYRIERELFRDNSYSRWPITSGSYIQALVDDYPEIENATRFWKREFSIKDFNNYTHKQSLFATDNSIFDIFSFKLESGDKNTALINPMSVVLTRELALNYLGTDDVIGKSLSFEWEGEPVDFEITGILKDVPKNSHIDFDMLISISSYPNERFSDWRSNYLYTYILASRQTTKAELENSLKSFVKQRLEPVYDDLLSQGLSIHEVLKIHLFPLRDIHLYPSPNWELDAGGNITSVYMFSSIAILILIIACINFMNLATATAKKRAKEVGLRKTMGGYKKQLVVQFILESIIISIIALVIALILISQFVLIFNSIFNEELSFFSTSNFTIFIYLIGITLLVGILAGLYPAFYLSKFDPVVVLKGRMLSTSGKPIFRRNMVIIQFVISIVLIIGTLTTYLQMKYLLNKSLGFDKENVVLIPARSQQVREGYNNFKNDVLHNPQIHSMAVSSDLPGEPFYSNTNFSSEEDKNNPVLLIILGSDYEFIETYNIDVVSGRAFSEEFGTDTEGTIMLNEAAVQRFGWKPEEAVGKELSFYGGLNKKVVGVLKDFNFRSLHSEIEPMAILLYPEYFDAISIKILPGDVKRNLDFIQQKWESTFSNEIFEFSFLDERMNQLYDNEMRIQNIFFIFSLFSIFVSCLGLFGLTSFVASERTKEIGIRKVLGASFGKIIMLLSKEFALWIIIANIIAWPIAWYIMTDWLQDFAHRININAWIFIASGLIAFVIAVFTISFQAVNAALANPVNSLRNE